MTTRHSESWFVFRAASAEMNWVMGMKARQMGCSGLARGWLVLNEFSGSAYSNFSLARKKTLSIFRICSSFGWVSRIDIALDTLPIILLAPG